MKQKDNDSTAGEMNYLDSIQLQTLENSFREWSQASSRVDVKRSRARIFLIFQLIRYTGAKLNEILSLNPLEDIDYEENLITLGGQTSSTRNTCRTIPLPKLLAKDIRSALEEQGYEAKGNGIFVADPGFVRRKFYERTEACGFDKKLGPPESIRKARTSELLHSNMPAQVVQSLLGNSTSNITGQMVSFSEEESHHLTKVFMEQEAGRKTSARNSFYGKIEHIEVGDILSRVEIATIDGFPLTAIVTNASLVELGLKAGRLITAQVKAPWVILQKHQATTLACTAENQLQGVISDIHEGTINTEYVVRISDMTELCSVVTTKSYKQLELERDDRVLAMFNGFSVVLHTN